MTKIFYFCKHVHSYDSKKKNILRTKTWHIVIFNAGKNILYNLNTCSYCLLDKMKRSGRLSLFLHNP